MKSLIHAVILTRKTITFLALNAASFILLSWAMAFAQSSPAPQVHLDADGLAPRPIEELTGTTIVHHYAQAWRNMEDALGASQSGGLNEEFTGFAKDRLTQRIADQQRTGVHVHIVDHGHNLKAIFYSTDGTAMQLLDRVQLEIQTFDGNKLLETQSVPREYMVLMTPGADRWYVRDLEEISAKSN